MSDITLCPTCPVADAGEDQFVTPESIVTLDGSNSFDPNGNIIANAIDVSNIITNHITASGNISGSGAHTATLSLGVDLAIMSEKSSWMHVRKKSILLLLIIHLDLQLQI